MIALIQAGGAGTRLKSITGDMPKPMVPLMGKPILEWQILSLKKAGIKSFIIVLGKNGDVVTRYFGDGEWLDVNISYIQEKEPLGTAGVLALVRDQINDDFIFCFGDLMLDIDWNRFVSFHKKHKGAVTAFAHPNSHPFDSDLLVTNKEDKILKIDSKNNVRNYYYKNLTNAGLYVCSREVIDFVKEPVKIDFEKVVLTHFIEEGKAFAYRSSEYVKDCGTPDRYYDVENDLKNGIIPAKSLLNKQKCIFLDRDGTINVFGDFVTNSDKFVLAPTSIEAIKLINHSEYLAICITNQPVIARGDTTFEELENIHNKMEDLLGEGGAYLNDLYFCPHHPDKGFEGEVKELKIDCDCRKPKIGNILKAKEKYNIDLSQSWFIGDTKQDVQTGINAGCRSILLTSGDPNPDKKYKEAIPTYTCSTLLEAVQYILAKDKEERK